VRLLLNFKYKYPDRVVLIIGNRDVNKLRLKTELDAVCVQKIKNELENQVGIDLDGNKQDLKKDFFH